MYIDPGAGNIIIQFLVGVAVAVPVIMKVFWGKIRAKLDRKHAKNTEFV